MAEEAKKYKNLYESLLTATMDKEAVRQDSLGRFVIFVQKCYLNA